MRVWHSPWSWLKLMVAAELVAGKTRIGMFTREILRNPFQVGRAAMEGLSAGWRAARHPAAQNCSELETHLELEHPGRVDIGQRRQRVGHAGGGRDDLPERRVHGRRVPVGRLRAAQHVAMV